jgi:hypothetical protein
MGLKVLSGNAQYYHLSHRVTGVTDPLKYIINILKITSISYQTCSSSDIFWPDHPKIARLSEEERVLL